MENLSSQAKNTQNKEDFKGFLLAFGAVFFWSFNVIFAHILKTELTPIQIAFFRWFIAALAFLPFTAGLIWKNRTVLLNHWKIVFILSFFGIALSNTFVYRASYTTTAVDMALIGTSGPIFLIFFARVFLNISVSHNQIIGIICALAGVITIISDGSLKSSIIYYLMPVLSTIEAYFILDEQIVTAQIYGGLLFWSALS